MSDMDRQREDVAIELTKALVGTGISVWPSSKSGPYEIRVSRLSRSTVEELAALIRDHIEAKGR